MDLEPLSFLFNNMTKRVGFEIECAYYAYKSSLFIGTGGLIEDARIPSPHKCKTRPMSSGGYRFGNVVFGSVN
jgi:hypothetical protein